MARRFATNARKSSPPPSEWVPPAESYDGLTDFASETDRDWLRAADAPAASDTRRSTFSALRDRRWYVPIAGALLAVGIVLVVVVVRGPARPPTPQAESAATPSPLISARHAAPIPALASRVFPARPVIDQEPASVVAVKSVSAAPRTRLEPTPTAVRTSPAAVPESPAIALSARSLSDGPAVLPSASVAASTPTTAVDETNAEVDAMLQTVNEYANAYERLDVRAAIAIWPSVDQRALTRAFGTLKSQSVQFESCLVENDGASSNIATVRCHGTVHFVRSVGSTTPRVERQQWVFKLRREGSEWRIDEVRTSQTERSRNRS